MEGLIPVVYKSLRRNKIRRRYECLSSGAAQAFNVDGRRRDFDDDHDHDHGHDYMSKKAESGAHQQRRCHSVRADRTGGFGSTDGAYEPEKLMRFRSHRMLSFCVAGN